MRRKVMVLVVAAMVWGVGCLAEDKGQPDVDQGALRQEIARVTVIMQYLQDQRDSLQRYLARLQDIQRQAQEQASKEKKKETKNEPAKKD